VYPLEVMQELIYTRLRIVTSLAVGLEF
jgi:hypothetical protein